MQPLYPVESFPDLPFPIHGIDLSEGFGMQVPDTTPIGLNVRAVEAQTQRGRGGVRPGLLKYIPAQLPNGAHLIQHLNIIVDPQGGAVGDLDDGDFPDPSSAGQSFLWGTGRHSRNPGRTIRRGGNGRMRFKNKKINITITADDQTKNQGDTFTFLGTEYNVTAGALDIGDAISGVTFTCAGAGAGAAAGAYPIIPSAAAGLPAGKYKITYDNGTMTVNPVALTGTLYVFNDGDHTWLTFIVPDGPLPFGDLDHCGGDGTTYQEDIDNGWLQSTTPGLATIKPPGLYCST